MSLVKLVARTASREELVELLRQQDTEIIRLTKEVERCEETLKAVRAVNKNEFGFVADEAIDRLVLTHFDANTPVSESAKPTSL